MASQFPPKKGAAFTLDFTLFKNDGSVIADPGTITKKISKDGGATADITAAVTEIDTTYGHCSIALSATEMSADRVWIYIKDDTSGCVPFTCTLYTAGSLHDEVKSAIDTIDGIVDAILEDTGTTIPANLSTISGYIDTEVAAILAAVDTEVAAIKAKTDNLPADPADQSAVEAAITAAHTTTNGKIDAVDDYIDTEVAAIKTVTDKLDTALELDETVYRFTANALELAPVDGAAPTAAAIRAEIDANSEKLAAIKAKTDNLPADPADQSAVEAAITAAHTTTNGKIDAVDDYIDTEVAAILAAVDTEVAAIKAKTDNLPADPADQSAVEAAITAAHTTTNGKIDAVDDYIDTEVAAIKTVTDKLDTALELDETVYRFTANALELAPVDGAAPTAAAIRAEIDANSEKLAAIKAKTDNLPADPADQSAVEAAITAAHTTTNGKIDAVDDYIDTEVAAILAAVDTEVAAIKAKTDNLPADPADQSAVEAAITAAHTTTNGKIDAVDDYIDTEIAAIKTVTDKLDTALELDETVYRFTVNALELAPVDGAAPTAAAIRAEIDANSEKLALLDVAVSTRTSLGAGGTSFTYTLTSTTSGLPIIEADVWVTTDIAGQNVIARGSTDQNGQINFLLSPGTLYFWRRKSGFTFNNPDVEVIS